MAKETLITEVEDFLRRSRSESQTIPEPAEVPRPSVAEISSFLHDALGPRLTALSVGVSDSREIVSWASGELQPDADIAQRLRNVYAIVRLLLQVETPQAVRAWFLGMNPELDDRAPALMLVDEPELVAQAARTLVASRVMGLLEPFRHQDSSIISVVTPIHLRGRTGPMLGAVALTIQTPILHTESST